MTSAADRVTDADERLRRYAELTVRVGANVQPGQEVVLLCQVEHASTARAIVRETYRAGASRVVMRYADQHERRAAIELGPRRCWAGVDRDGRATPIMRDDVWVL